jgi:hypothetical protein
MSRAHHSNAGEPSQRMLRVAELIRHSVAESLARHAGPVTIDRVESLVSPSLARKLVTGGQREFGGVRELSAAAAAELARVEGTLFLDSLAELPADTALALAAHQGDLSLDGLATLSAGAAEGLARHRGDLSLAGLGTPSAEVRRALTGHAGPVLSRGEAAASTGR